jgi:predicted AAA+ superfamily ATPase
MRACQDRLGGISRLPAVAPFHGRAAAAHTGEIMEIDWKHTVAAVWRQRRETLHPVKSIDPVTLDELIGIDAQKWALQGNTERFLSGRPANNALLWGARGTGKSSLIKAILNEYHAHGLRLIEIGRDDLVHLPDVIDAIRELSHRFIVYTDDFSFEDNENSYVALKSILEGSIERPPENALLYATSNRRHLLPEYAADSEGTRLLEGELHYCDAVEEKMSLSDRFGLWLSFYQPDMRGYLAIVDSYFRNYTGDRNALHEAARLFAMARASRSGRTARQFYNAHSGLEE